MSFVQLSAADLRAAISENLRGFEARESPNPRRPAAVAIVVMKSKGVPSIPIFQRPLNMKRHAGQMALPGGTVHEPESIEECAIREVYEELGLPVDRADVLGRLDVFDTMSGFSITPLVMWSGAEVSSLRPSEDEVARLFVIGTSELRETVAAAAQETTRPFSLRFREVEVFAPTAAILYQFSEAALDGRPCRVADFYQPPFTHR